jgi:hypothetical protein
VRVLVSTFAIRETKSEISMDIYLSLTLTSTRFPAATARLFTLHSIAIYASTSLPYSSPFFLLSITCSSVPRIMPTKAELVSEIYLLLAAIHLHGFVMSPEMAQKIFDRWRTFTIFNHT